MQKRQKKWKKEWIEFKPRRIPGLIDPLSAMKIEDRERRFDPEPEVRI